MAQGNWVLGLWGDKNLPLRAWIGGVEVPLQNRDFWFQGPVTPPQTFEFWDRGLQDPLLKNLMLGVGGGHGPPPQTSGFWFGVLDISQTFEFWVEGVRPKSPHDAYSAARP